VQPFIRPLTDLKWFYGIKGYKLISAALPAFTARYMNFKQQEPGRDKTPQKEKPLDERFFTSAKAESKDPFQRAVQPRPPGSPRLVLKTKNSQEAILVEILEEPSGSLGALLKRDEISQIRQKEIPKIHVIEKKPAGPEAAARQSPEQLAARQAPGQGTAADLRFMKEYSLEHYYKSRNPKGQLPEVAIEEPRFELGRASDEPAAEEDF
jgi:hypothetical protein